MFRDPRQFLLLHAEKVVFVVILLLVVLVAAVYHPWRIEVPEKARITTAMKECEEKMGQRVWTNLPPVSDYVGKVNAAYERPWPEDSPPMPVPASKIVFMNVRRSGWKPEAPGGPPVAAVKTVYAKANKGQVVAVFNIDDPGERRALELSGVPEYGDGLDFDHIEIWRLDKSTGENVLITPAMWLPKGLPRRYGAPPGWVGEEPAGPHGMFGEPVYIFAQAGTMTPAQTEAQRRLDEQRKRLMEEEIRHQKELQQQLEEARRLHATPGGPAKLGPAPGPVKPEPGVKPGGPAAAFGAQAGWYYFIDPNVDPDARYEYSVIIVCRNPIFGAKKQYETGSMPKTVSSRPVSTATSLAPVVVEEFKKWWFQGGTPELETGRFKVRCLVGGQRDITEDDIRGIVAEFSATTETTPGTSKPVKKPGEKAEPEGVWIEQEFSVRPGEEIGGKATVTVNGEKREVDFATGCTLVSIWTDVQVTEDIRQVMMTAPGKGTPETVERINRVVHPGKLRIAYMDHKGKMKTRWQEVAPPIAKSGAPE